MELYFEHQLYSVRVNHNCGVSVPVLSGGVVSPGLTEIVGESASGKTQLCMQLCLTVQLPRNLGTASTGKGKLCQLISTCFIVRSLMALTGPVVKLADKRDA